MKVSSWACSNHEFMQSQPTRSDGSARVRVLWALSWPLFLLGFGLRIVLYAQFRDTAFEVFTLARVLALGVVLDVVAYTVLLAPAILGLTLFSVRTTRKRGLIVSGAALVLYGGLYSWADRQFGVVGALITLIVPVMALFACVASIVLARPWPRRVAFVALFAAATFGTAVEYFFFEEFNSRYNHIALDYVLYPTEVVTNLWESYPIVLFVALALVCGIGLTFLAERGLARGPLSRTPFGFAWRSGLLGLVAVSASATIARYVPQEVSQNRIVSEVAQNGLLQLVRAFRTSELDYELYYTTLPQPEARARAASVLGFAPPTPDMLKADNAQFELQRSVKSARPNGAPPLDVVVVLEESLGSNFIGTLGATPSNLTPEFDRWSKDGLLFENLVANGNRTVRGLEGVLCSFVPLPGDSITKRSPPADAATLARVYTNAGYDTEFFYGGAGTFDGMEPFMSKNGWNDFFEQRNYPSGCFTTAWGVADEHIFDALLARQVRAESEGKRFFGTLMSVSNHKPYLVPQGRTPLADGPPSRNRAVSYSDWAIGRYLDAAKARGLLAHTLVLIVGDHGARVYGRELIPVESYRIPALFVSPDEAYRGKRFPRLCSQVDLGPTLVALSGITCDVPFLGRDLSSLEDGPGRAFVQHNRDVGYLTDDVLVVLGLQKTVTFYKRDGRTSSTLSLVSHNHVDEHMRGLEDDAVAVFQTAYEVYRAGRYLPSIPAR